MKPFTRFFLFILLLSLAALAHSATFTLSLTNVSGYPGSTGRVIYVNLSNPQEVSLGLAIVYDPKVIKVTKVIKSGRNSLDMTTNFGTINFTPGRVTVGIFTLQGESIPPGTGEVGRVYFDILPTAFPGSYPLTITSLNQGGNSSDLLVLKEGKEVTDISTTSGTLTVLKPWWK